MRTDADVGSDAVAVSGRGLDLEGDMARRHIAQGRRQERVLRHSIPVSPTISTGFAHLLRDYPLRVAELRAAEAAVREGRAQARRCSVSARVPAWGGGGSGDDPASIWQ